MSKKWLGIALVLCGFTSLKAQDIPAYAFKNVNIHTHDGKVIEKASVVWRNGSIESFGTSVTIPFDAKVIDGGDSLHVYPGFIDGFSELGAPDIKRNTAKVDKPGEPPFDVAGIQPERVPSNEIDFKDKDIKSAQKAGFTMASVGLKGLMLPGQMDMFYLGSGDVDNNLFTSGIGQKAAFKNTRSVYPSTLMGTMLMFRQLWADASALQISQANYMAEPTKFTDPGHSMVHEALYGAINKSHPLFFEVDSKENVERLFSLQDELGFNVVLTSVKEGFRFTDLIKKKKVSVLVSLDLPEKPEWKTKEEKAKKDTTKKEVKAIPADVQAFRDKQWAAYESHVNNLKSLLDAGVNPGFTSNGLKKWSDLSKNIETIKEMGVSESDLVKVFTINTAKALGMDSKMGKIDKGYIANLAVFTKPFTEKKAKLLYNVVKGDLNDFK